MFGKSEAKLKTLSGAVGKLQTENMALRDSIRDLKTRLYILENPSKYDVGFEVKDKYLITDKICSCDHCYVPFVGGGYTYVSGWKYTVFDKESNKTATMWEDQITKFIEGTKK